MNTTKEEKYPCEDCRHYKETFCHKWMEPVNPGSTCPSFIAYRS